MPSLFDVKPPTTPTEIEAAEAKKQVHEAMSRYYSAVCALRVAQGQDSKESNVFSIRDVLTLCTLDVVALLMVWGKNVEYLLRRKPSFLLFRGLWLR
jgi:hypothetical protein